MQPRLVESVQHGRENRTHIVAIRQRNPAIGQAFIHSTLGFRYLTLYVTDINQILARLKKAGVPTLGETPMEMGAGTWLVAIKDPDGNFIEFVGPRK
jgi:catechol 2,3-dioxygenase-like lactoylglutathione lyase family enzyme